MNQETILGFILSHESLNMFSTKYTAIIAVAAFVSGSFVASPELRASAAATITSADIVNETIQSNDIKNGEVKSPDIADGAVRSVDIGTDQVTDRELAGDIQCVVGGGEYEPEETFTQICGTDYSGGLDGTFIIATMNNIDPALKDEPACFDLMGAEGTDDEVEVMFKNTCDTTETFATSTVSLLVFQ